MTDLADDIKRIVGIDQPQAPAPTLSGPGGQEGARVAASQSSSGVTVGELKNKQEEEEENKKKGVDKKTDDEASKDDETKADGDQNGGKPNSKSKTSGVYPAKEVVDNNKGPDVKQDITFPMMGLAIGNGTLTGITATDCATGDTLNIRLDGTHVPPDATTWTDGTPRTSEWEDPNTPPDVPGFELGFKWSSATIVPYDAATPFDMDSLGAAIVGQNLGASGQTGGPGTVYGPASGNYYVFTSYSAVSATQYDVTMFQSDSGGNRLGPDFIAFNVTRSACTPGSGASCPLTAPKESNWPEDSVISLTHENGKYVTNQYDTDPTPQYTGQENSVINFCMDGGRYGRIEAGVNGGHIIYETTAAGNAGSPTGIARYFNSAGELTGFSDATSIDFYRPKST